MAYVSHSLGTVIGFVNGRRCRFFALGCLGLGPGVVLMNGRTELCVEAFFCLSGMT